MLVSLVHRSVRVRSQYLYYFSGCHVPEGVLYFGSSYLMEFSVSIISSLAYLFRSFSSA